MSRWGVLKTFQMNDLLGRLPSKASFLINGLTRNIITSINNLFKDTLRSEVTSNQQIIDYEEAARYIFINWADRINWVTGASDVWMSNKPSIQLSGVAAKIEVGWISISIHFGSKSLWEAAESRVEHLAAFVSYSAAGLRLVTGGGHMFTSLSKNLSTTCFDKHGCHHWCRF